MSYRILIVDDELVIRQVLERHLSQKGYEVFTAADGKEALEALRRQKPHIMILDIKMPNMDGLEVLQMLRKERNDIPIIVLTAYDDLAEQTMDMGASDYLTKPFELDYLESRILTNLMTKSPFQTPRDNPSSGRQPLR